MITDKIGGSNRLSTEVVSLPAGNRRSFTWKRVDKETEQGNTTALPPVDWSKGLHDKIQIHTEHFEEGTDLTFRVGRENGLEKEKGRVESHLLLSKGMQEPSSQNYPLLKSQRHTFLVETGNTPHEGEVVRMEEDPLVINEKGSNFGNLRRDEEGRLSLILKKSKSLHVWGM